jgi:hypothetical protein
VTLCLILDGANFDGMAASLDLSKKSRRDVLSPYQRYFLRDLDSFGVIYLVVGGQGRRLCMGEPGYDLDLWLEFSDDNFDPILRALLSWARAYPMHVLDNFVDQFPAELRDGLQCNFPATVDRVWYMHNEQKLSVSSEDGVNALIGSKVGVNFRDYLNRARWTVVDGMNVPCMATDDDLELPRLKVRSRDH